MRSMVEAGGVDALVPERVWQEIVEALAEPRPSRFFAVLRDCGALERLCGLARVTARYHGLVHKRDELRPGTILDLIEGADAFRRPERFEQMLIACAADYRSRAGYEGRTYPQGERLRRLYAAVGALDVGAIAAAAPEPAHIPQRIRAARIGAIREALEPAS